MKKIFLLLLICFIGTKLSAQSFYVNSYNYVAHKSEIHKITIKANGVESELMTICNGSDFFSIAVNSQGLYWLNGAFLFHADLDINNNAISNCKVVTPTLVGSNSLAASADNKLYYSDGNDLWMTDLATLKSVKLGNMGFSAAGDLTFYKGELYMASNVLVKVNIGDPTKSTYYLSLDPSTYGLVTVSTGLRKNTVYALVIQNDGSTAIQELDMENRHIVRTVGTVPYQILDAGSEAEDGTIPGIDVEKINIRQDCTTPDKGMAEIVTVAHRAPFTYELKNGGSNTTGIFSGLPAGDYEVKIIAPDDVRWMTFTVPAYSSAAPAYKYTVKNQVCEAPGEIAFSTPTGTSEFKIQLGSDVYPLNHTFSNLTANTYHFVVINDNGCQVSQADVVLPRDKCTIQFDKTAVNKECDAVNKGSIAVLTTVPHPYTYAYTLNGITNATGVFNQLNPGSYDITINSPEDVKIVSAIVPDYSLSSPKITYTSINPVCEVSGSIKLSTANPGLYMIKTSAGTFAFDHNFTGLVAGTYHFSIIDQQKCLVNELDVTLTQDQCLIKFDKVVVQQQCDVIYKGMLQVTTKPHQDQYSYTLNGLTNLTGTFTNLGPGNYNIQIKSPEDELIVPVSVPDYKALQSPISITKTDHACATKGTIRFSVQDNNSNLYKIQFQGNTFPFDHTFDNLTKGKYQFTVLKQNGCIVDNYEAEISYLPCPIFINDISVLAECHVLGKGFITVTCPPIPETYTYTLNNTQNSTGVFNMLDPGTYQLTVSASGGNTPQQRTVVVPDFTLNKPTTTVNSKLPVCNTTGQISLAISNPGLYNISFNSSVYPADHVFTGLLAGSYHFDILKKNGCIVDALDVTLAQEDCNPIVFPNTFTPNNDGINDIFRASPVSKGSHFTLKIFDRAGVTLFYTNDLSQGWNGEYKGKAMPATTYYYLSTFVTQENKSSTQSGSVTLIR